MLSVTFLGVVKFWFGFWTSTLCSLWVFLETFTETFHAFLFTFEVYASNLWCKDSVRVTMHLLNCQGFWEWWVNLLVKHEYTLLEKSGFHSPVQYLKMMEDKALPVITTRIKWSDFQVIFCKCYVKLRVFWYFAWPTFSNKKQLIFLVLWSGFFYPSICGWIGIDAKCKCSMSQSYECSIKVAILCNISANTKMANHCWGDNNVSCSWHNNFVRFHNLEKVCCKKVYSLLFRFFL